MCLHSSDQHSCGSAGCSPIPDTNVFKAKLTRNGVTKWHHVTSKSHHPRDFSWLQCQSLCHTRVQLTAMVRAGLFHPSEKTACCSGAPRSERCKMHYVAATRWLVTLSEVELS